MKGVAYVSKFHYLISLTKGNLLHNFFVSANTISNYFTHKS